MAAALVSAYRIKRNHRWRRRCASGRTVYAYVSSNPINLTDPLGLAPGDCYATADQAAAQAIADIFPLSVRQDLEYAGWIYQNSNGWYSYTGPQRGGIAVSSPGQRVSGAIGNYHTHGGVTPGYVGEQFSDVDLGYHQNGDRNYLGTPSGRVLLDNGRRITEVNPAQADSPNSCSCGGKNSTINQLINLW